MIWTNLADTALMKLAWDENVTRAAPETTTTQGFNYLLDLQITIINHLLGISILCQYQFLHSKHFHIFRS